MVQVYLRARQQEKTVNSFSSKNQGIIQNQHPVVGHCPLKYLTIKCLFSKKYCYFKVFLCKTMAKVSFFKDSRCCPKILDYTLKIYTYINQWSLPGIYSEKIDVNLLLSEKLLKKLNKHINHGLKLLTFGSGQIKYH